MAWLVILCSLALFKGSQGHVVPNGKEAESRMASHPPYCPDPTKCPGFKGSPAAAADNVDRQSPEGGFFCGIPGPMGCMMPENDTWEVMAFGADYLPNSYIMGPICEGSFADVLNIDSPRFFPTAIGMTDFVGRSGMEYEWKATMQFPNYPVRLRAFNYTLSSDGRCLTFDAAWKVKTRYPQEWFKTSVHISYGVPFDVTSGMWDRKMKLERTGSTPPPHVWPLGPTPLIDMFVFIGTCQALTLDNGLTNAQIQERYSFFCGEAIPTAISNLIPKLWCYMHKGSHPEWTKSCPIEFGWVAQENVMPALGYDVPAYEGCSCCQ